MKVKELIEELKKFDEDLEVRSFDGEYDCFYIVNSLCLVDVDERTIDCDSCGNKIKKAFVQIS